MNWKLVLGLLFIIGAVAAMIKGKGVTVLLVSAALFGLVMGLV